MLQENGCTYCVNFHVGEFVSPSTIFSDPSWRWPPSRPFVSYVLGSRYEAGVRARLARVRGISSLWKQLSVSMCNIWQKRQQINLEVRREVPHACSRHRLRHFVAANRLWDSLKLKISQVMNVSSFVDVNSRVSLIIWCWYVKLWGSTRMDVRNHASAARQRRQHRYVAMTRE